MSAQTHSGGCQCGAVRYRFTEKPTGAHVCYCRMCQKAFGAFYAPLVGGPARTFEVTRGEIAEFASSEITRRGFCRDCGTPLSIRDVGEDWMAVSIGSLDDPSAFPPESQHGIDRRYGFMADIPALPEHASIEERQPDFAARVRRTNRQHPDHDTEAWPE